jgi:hypothetical protein
MNGEKSDYQTPYLEVLPSFVALVGVSLPISSAALEPATDFLEENQ